MPHVTVVIPAFNAETHIGATLSSIANQTFSDFEVIVVDDGSTDGTITEAERYADRMSLRVISQRNAGPSAARNKGVRAARGRYCAFLDADDLMLPRRLAVQAESLDAQPDLGLVHSDLMTFDSSGTIHTTRRVFSNPCSGMILDRLLLDNFITTSTVMAPKHRLIEAGLFDEKLRLSEDFDLWLRIAERWAIGYIEEPLVRYRRRHGSLSDDKLVTGMAALEVVEHFWRSHENYAASNPRIRRKSIAHHLSIAATAALNQTKLLRALGFLARSVCFDPFSIATWKQVAKAALLPLLGTERVPADGGARRT
jgi:glycosyltransferase involved in cell wall biosynthesis